MGRKVVKERKLDDERMSMSNLFSNVLQVCSNISFLYSVLYCGLLWHTKSYSLLLSFNEGYTGLLWVTLWLTEGYGGLLSVTVQ